MNKLLAEKIFTAFLGGFFGALVVSLQGLVAQPGFGWSKSLLISAVVGAIAAGIRATLALSPVNVESTDTQHTVKVGKAT